MEQGQETRDRWFQIVIEWWKCVYDFYKHLMTIALLAIGTVGALVGGPFKSVVKLDNTQAALGPKVLVVVIVVAFTIAAATAVQGMHSARQKMFHMKDFSNEVDIRNLELRLRRLRDSPVGMLWEVSPKTVWWTVSVSSLVGVLAFVSFLLDAMF
jgi:hypothetical protein